MANEPTVTDADIAAAAEMHLCSLGLMTDDEFLRCEREAFARHRHASTAELRGLLREAEVKLIDVQGAYATKQYAANLLARIREALGGNDA